MSSFPDSEYRESRSAPTVSRDKWILHARTKLDKGYSLIISEGRKNASFFLAGRGYEPCPFVTAKRLVELRVVVASGKHPLGALYTLSPDAVDLNTAIKQDPDEVDLIRTDDDDDSGAGLLTALDSLEGDSEEELEADDDSEEEAADEPIDEEDDDDEDI